MALYLWWAVMAANAPMEITPIAKMVNIMAMIQSSVSQVDIAAKSERNWLFVLVGWVVISALITALLTVLLFRKTGKLQEALKKDADARISESNAEAKRAGESAGLANERAGIANESAGKANERAEKLEGDNLKLRTDLETATAESRAKQTELATEQTKLSAEQRKTAEAQRDAAIAQRALAEKTEEIRKRTEPRHLTDPQRARLVELFRANEKGQVSITCLNADFDSCDFAKQIADTLSVGGWKVEGPHDIMGFGPDPRPPRGLFILVHSHDAVPARAIVLQKALEAIGFAAPAEIRGEEGAVGLFVGAKP